MPQEIEHKYLVRLDVWKPTESGVLFRQGYLSTAEQRVVRVRIAGERAYLTIKGSAHGITRPEFEYAIPVADAATMLDLPCERPLSRRLGIANRLAEKHGKSMSFTVTMLASSSPR
jgi:adenylate cyclase